MFDLPHIAVINTHTPLRPGRAVLTALFTHSLPLSCFCLAAWAVVACRGVGGRRRRRTPCRGVDLIPHRSKFQTQVLTYTCINHWASRALRSHILILNARTHTHTHTHVEVAQKWQGLCTGTVYCVCWVFICKRSPGHKPLTGPAGVFKSMVKLIRVNGE